jgi:quinol monooxygenase YgiN
MDIISKENSVIHLISVIAVKPEDQQKLLNIIIDLADNIMVDIPGFISVRLHNSIDKKQVIIYAQWKSREAWEAMVKNPKVHHHFRQIEEIKDGSDNYALYELAYFAEGRA